MHVDWVTLCIRYVALRLKAPANTTCPPLSRLIHHRTHQHRKEILRVLVFLLLGWKARVICIHLGGIKLIYCAGLECPLWARREKATPQFQHQKPEGIAAIQGADSQILSGLEAMPAVIVRIPKDEKGWIPLLCRQASGVLDQRRADASALSERMDA